MNYPHALALGAIGAKTGSAVVRRDTPVLCESLTYAQGMPEVLEGTPTPSGRPNVSVYAPPFDEFEVVRISIPASAHSTPVGMQESLPKSSVRSPLHSCCLPRLPVRIRLPCMHGNKDWKSQSLHLSNLKQYTGSATLANGWAKLIVIGVDRRTCTSI